VFADLRTGVYAVSVFHDENMNEKLDKNFYGHAEGRLWRFEQSKEEDGAAQL